MDTEYARIGDKDGGLYTAFEHSLFVLATVISVPADDRAIVDAGLKSYSGEKGPPWVHGLKDVEVTNISDEHGKLKIGAKAKRLRLGEGLAHPRPLRSDGQPARLVCRRTARPSRSALAHHGARREHVKDVPVADTFDPIAFEWLNFPTGWNQKTFPWPRSWDGPDISTSRSSSGRGSPTPL